MNCQCGIDQWCCNRVDYHRYKRQPAIDRFDFQFWDLADIPLHQYEPSAVEKKNARGKPSFHSAALSFTPILGLISCFGLLFYLKTNAIIAAGVWIALGLVAYEYNKRREANPD